MIFVLYLSVLYRNTFSGNILKSDCTPLNESQRPDFSIYQQLEPVPCSNSKTSRVFAICFAICLICKICYLSSDCFQSIQPSVVNQSAVLGLPANRQFVVSWLARLQSDLQLTDFESETRQESNIDNESFVFTSTLIG